MTRLKTCLFAAAAMGLSTALVLALALAADLYAHARYKDLVGLNVRGYRGPIAKRKRPGERRIVVLGGSTAFGYGVPWDEAFPAFLERKLNAQRTARGQGPVSVINLAYNSEGAYSFPLTLNDYASLGYDVALLYTGYNDLDAEQNTYVFRRGSAVFRLTGYLPILPMILREKALALRYGGDLEAAYRGEKTVFRPNLADRTGAAVLEQAVRIGDSLSRQLGRLSDGAYVADVRLGENGCREPWTRYCASVCAAVDDLLSRGKRALVVTQPYMTEGHIQQQQALAAVLAERFATQPRVRVADLGRTISLDDRSLAYDGMHLTAKGNAIIADALVEPASELLALDK